jgi:hypothetical protein
MLVKRTFDVVERRPVAGFLEARVHRFEHMTLDGIYCGD